MSAAPDVPPPASNDPEPDTAPALLALPDLSRLTLRERMILRFLHAINTRPQLKRLGQLWSHTAFNWGGWLFFNRVMVVTHPERLTAVKPETPLLLLANHRTFWDMFVLSLIQYRLTRHIRAGYFPVRSSFFYEKFSGVFINLLFSGGSMYPPIFRDRRRGRLNLQMMEHIARLAGRPRVVIGYHPEGTRNRDTSPYELLPGRSGTGRLLLAAWKNGAHILPVFMHELDPWLPRQLWNNIRRHTRLNVVIGEPLDLADLADKPTNAATFHAVTALTMKRLAALASEERGLRQPSKPPISGS